MLLLLSSLLACAIASSSLADEASLIPSDYTLDDVGDGGGVPLSVPSVHSKSSTSPTTPPIGLQSDERRVWGEWIVATPCTNSCGACGRIRLVRECLCEGEDNCPCSAAESRVEVCATSLCQHPRPTCCQGFRKALTADGFKCAAKDEIETERVCEGQWSAWIRESTVGQCSKGCGMCGQRRVATRKCEPKGCECQGKSSLFESCGSKPCQVGKTCCEGFVKGRTDGREECIPGSISRAPLLRDSRRFFDEKKTAERKEKEHRKNDLRDLLPLLDANQEPERLDKKRELSISTCRGIWSPFSALPLSSSPCDHVCGLCGHRPVAQRECIPAGCTCPGASKLLERCGELPCWSMKNSCCAGATLVLVDGKRICREE